MANLNSRTPVARITHVSGLTVCQTNDGTVIVPIQWDYAAWTPMTECFITSLKAQKFGKESKSLRLAVKDLIDMKGIVTTAGSEYVAETSQPATSDAACLMIARARNVRIVGKTHLSELAVAPSGINDFSLDAGRKRS